MNVMVIYEEIPESTKIYMIEMTKEEYDTVKEAHNRFINVDESNLAMDYFNIALSKPDDYLNDYADEVGVSRDVIGKWHKNVLDVSEGPYLPAKKIDAVIVTGFAL